MKLNFFAVQGNEIDVVIGEPIDLSSFKGRELNRDTYMEAAEICLDAVRQLGQKQKQIQAQRQAEQ